MGIFDIFGTSDQNKAAADQTAALTKGYSQYGDLAGQGRNALQTNYDAALPAYQQNYNTANAGQNQYAALLGIGGQGGSAPGAAGTGAAPGTAPGGGPPAAGGGTGTMDLQALLSKIPGYQFALDQGSQNVLRNGAATGTTASGGTLNALQQQGQGAASQNYFNYLNALQPFLGQANSAAGGIAGVNTGLGNALNRTALDRARRPWERRPASAMRRRARTSQGLRHRVIFGAACWVLASRRQAYHSESEPCPTTTPVFSPNLRTSPAPETMRRCCSMASATSKACWEGKRSGRARRRCNSRCSGLTVSLRSTITPSLPRLPSVAAWNR